MIADNLLIAGAIFILSLAIGQALIKRRQAANKILTGLFAITFVWIAHGIGYRYGMVDRIPHLNKVYLPLLCATGSMWYTYVCCLHDDTGQFKYNRQYLLMPLVCVLLSIPFYLQSAEYKRIYIETDLADWPSIFMYAASRVAELTILWFFVKSALFLYRLPDHKKPDQRFGVSRTLWYLSIAAVVATVTRIAGSVSGDKTVSVLYPCLIAIAVFAVMHFLSYRNPVVLSLSHSSRTIKVKPTGSTELDSIRQQLQTHQWFLDPDLKVQSLARKTGMPAAELSALINTVTGMNFNEFVYKYRIDFAKELLLQDEKMSIINVAYASGYNSKSAFYKHFSADTSMTPVQYRKSRKIPADAPTVTPTDAKADLKKMPSKATTKYEPSHS